MTCPECKADVTLIESESLSRFRAHDRGFRGRARREQWRMDLCPVSGLTVAEAAARKVGA